MRKKMVVNKGDNENKKLVPDDKIVVSDGLYSNRSLVLYLLSHIYNYVKRIFFRRFLLVEVDLALQELSSILLIQIDMLSGDEDAASVVNLVGIRLREKKAIRLGRAKQIYNVFEELETVVNLLKNKYFDEIKIFVQIVEGVGYADNGVFDQYVTDILIEFMYIVAGCLTRDEGNLKANFFSRKGGDYNGGRTLLDALIRVKDKDMETSKYYHYNLRMIGLYKVYDCRWIKLNKEEWVCGDKEIANMFLVKSGDINQKVLARLCKIGNNIFVKDAFTTWSMKLDREEVITSGFPRLRVAGLFYNTRFFKHRLTIADIGSCDVLAKASLKNKWCVYPDNVYCGYLFFSLLRRLKNRNIRKLYSCFFMGVLPPTIRVDYGFSWRVQFCKYGYYRGVKNRWHYLFNNWKDHFSYVLQFKVFFEEYFYELKLQWFFNDGNMGFLRKKLRKIYRWLLKIYKWFFGK